MAAPVTTRKRFTATQYESLTATGVLTKDDHVELIDGHIIHLAPTTPPRAATVSRLNQLLHQSSLLSVLIRAHGPIKVDDYSELQSDISIVRWRSDCYASAFPQAHDVLLLIEVAESSLSYDRDAKLPLYARAGIPEVWIVALLPQTVEVFRSPRENVYGESAVFRRGDTITALNLPQVTLTVDSILG